LVTASADIENGFAPGSGSRRTLVKLLRAMQVKKILQRQGRGMLYLRLAAASMQLHQYSFAMRCYYHSNIVTDTVAGERESSFAEALMPALEVENDEIDLIPPLSKASVATDAFNIHETFNDGKNALVCALLLQVKQPSAGRRKVFVGLNNVGHSFITLVKYNTDGSAIARSFGFYPVKTDLFAATPVHPVALSVIKDDAYHDCDEVVGKFISLRRFQRILRLLTKIEKKRYDLNKNNCTDFALHAAVISGIEVRETKGYWPFGRGNNPACLGQSLLEGKLVNTDTGSSDGLFQWHNPLLRPTK